MYRNVNWEYTFTLNTAYDSGQNTSRRVTLEIKRIQRRARKNNERKSKMSAVCTVIIKVTALERNRLSMT